MMAKRPTKRQLIREIRRLIRERPEYDKRPLRGWLLPVWYVSIWFERKELLTIRSNLETPDAGPPEDLPANDAIIGFAITVFSLITFLIAVIWAFNQWSH